MQPVLKSRLLLIATLIALSLSACKDAEPDTVAVSAPAPPAPAAALPPVPTLSADRQNELLAEAREHLDNHEGNGERLAPALTAIEEVLSDNPNNVEGRILRARHYLYTGYQHSRRYDYESLEAAKRELESALAIDPKSADAHIALAEVLSLAESYPKALEALERAREIGSANPRLYLNAADVHTQLKEWDKAQAQLEELESRVGGDQATPTKVKVSLAAAWLKVHMALGDNSAITRDHKKILKLKPDSAWAHGNYASHLLFKVGDTEGSLVEGEKALALMDYGIARTNLGLAQYAKWARLSTSSPQSARSLYESAQQNLPNPDHAMAWAASHVDSNPDFKKLVVALMEKGISIDAPGSTSMSGLVQAACCGRASGIEWLLSKGANLEGRAADGFTALGGAIFNQRKDNVDYLLAHGADVNAPANSDDSSPLTLALYAGDTPTAKKLIALGADVNAEDKSGHTPFEAAAMMGNKELVAAMLTPATDIGDASSFAHKYGHTELGHWIRDQAALRPKADNAPTRGKPPVQ